MADWHSTTNPIDDTLARLDPAFARIVAPTLRALLRPAVDPRDALIQRLAAQLRECARALDPHGDVDETADGQRVANRELRAQRDAWSLAAEADAQQDA